MNTSMTEIQGAKAQQVAVTEDTITVDLVDGRTSGGIRGCCTARQRSAITGA